MLKAKRLKKPAHKDKNPDPVFHFHQEDSEDRIRSVLCQNLVFLEDADVMDSLLTTGKRWTLQEPATFGDRKITPSPNPLEMDGGCMRNKCNYQLKMSNLDEIEI